MVMGRVLQMGSGPQPRMGMPAVGGEQASEQVAYSMRTVGAIAVRRQENRECREE